MIEDISDFLKPETEKQYNEKGIPYRRGYLLYGPPGTRKTSTIYTLAGYFNLSIYFIPLASLEEDHVITLFRQLPRRYIVLLEDFDRTGIQDNQSSSYQRKITSVSTLLNLIDSKSYIYKLLR